MSLLHLPNVLSALRLVATPLAISMILGERPGALLLFAAAAFTDWLDGRLARKIGSESQLGAVLDPLADKVFGVGVLWALVARGDLPAWMLWVLVIKEALLLAGGALLLRKAGEVTRARMPGKVATTVLFVAFAAILAGVRPLGEAAAAAGVALSLAAGADYARLAARQLRRSEA